MNINRYLFQGIAEDAQAGKRVVVVTDQPREMLARTLEVSGHGRPHFNAYAKLNYGTGGQVIFVTDTEDEILRGIRFDVIVSPNTGQTAQFLQNQLALGAEVIVY